MAWRLSTGMTKALLGGTPSVANSINADTIAFVDGGASEDTITDSGSGFITAGFEEHQWVLIVGGTNNNILVKVVAAVAGTLTIPTASITAVAAGTQVCLINFGAGGSLQEILKNGTMDLYSSTRPTSADAAETGTALCPITLDAAAFVAGEATNGLNLGTFSGTTIKRATDPETGVVEVWKGLGIADGTAGWGRWYANDKTTGASTTAIRMDGVVATSGAEINMLTGTAIQTGYASEVSDVSFTMTTA